jgi:hypothetical protein
VANYLFCAGNVTVVARWLTLNIQGACANERHFGVHHGFVGQKTLRSGGAFGRAALVLEKTLTWQARVKFMGWTSGGREERRRVQSKMPVCARKIECVCWGTHQILVSEGKGTAIFSAEGGFWWPLFAAYWTLDRILEFVKNKIHVFRLFLTISTDENKKFQKRVRKSSKYSSDNFFFQETYFSLN